MRISSAKYVNGARGQPCKLRIPHVCDGGGETTVFAHIRDQHTGRGIKASDVSGADACHPCHAKFDGQAGEPLSREDWLFYAVRGLQETLEDRIRRGIVIVPLDPERLSSERQVSPRKPPSERKPVPQNPDRKLQSKSVWPKGRKIPVRAKERTE